MVANMTIIVQLFCLHSPLNLFLGYSDNGNKL